MCACVAAGCFVDMRAYDCTPSTQGYKAVKAEYGTDCQNTTNRTVDWCVGELIRKYQVWTIFVELSCRLCKVKEVVAWDIFRKKVGIWKYDDYVTFNLKSMSLPFWWTVEENRKFEGTKWIKSLVENENYEGFQLDGHDLKELLGEIPEDYFRVGKSTGFRLLFHSMNILIPVFLAWASICALTSTLTDYVRAPLG